MKGLGNHDRLLKDLLLHVMAIIALLDGRRGRAGLDDLALDWAVVAIEDLDPPAPNDGPVAFLQISDALRPGCYCDRVRTEIVLAVTVPDCQRRTHARSDQQVGIVAEEESDGERTLQPRKYSGDGVLGRCSALDLARNQMAHDFGIRLALECAAFAN